MIAHVCLRLIGSSSDGSGFHLLRKDLSAPFPAEASKSPSLCSASQKRRVKSFERLASRVLEEHFAKKRKATNEERKALAEATNLCEAQVLKWISTRRGQRESEGESEDSTTVASANQRIQASESIPAVSLDPLFPENEEFSASDAESDDRAPVLNSLNALCQNIIVHHLTQQSSPAAAEGTHVSEPLSRQGLLMNIIDLI